MGFGSFVKHLTKPITRALGPVGTAVLLPAVPITQLAANVADKVVAGAMTPKNVSPQPVMQRGIPGSYGPQPGYNVSYGAPTYAPPSYGGGGFQPSYQPAEPFYGGSPWGSSTQYSQPLTTPWVTYSAPQAQPPQGRIWEDLIMGALPFIL